MKSAGKSRSFPIIGRKAERAEFLSEFGALVKEAMGETLEQALKRCYGDASKSLYSQARSAASQASLELYERRFGGQSDIPLSRLLEVVSVLDIRGEDVRNATAKFYKDGLSPATINKRLNCLSKMGVSVEGLRVKNPKQMKWHLKESDRGRVIEVCLSSAALQQWPDLAVLAALITWTTRTGLRIEESLRLRYCDFSAGYTAVSVMGTKTNTAQATLPLGPEVSQMLTAWEAKKYAHNQADLVFPVSYLQLQNAWDVVRQHFGWKDDPTATLKALRRSAARYLHVDCNMPLHMVQQYLRHESMDTTLEYLRLTGGYGTEEMRRFLK